MNPINVKSEIKQLKKVLLHRPGRELLNLTPDRLEELLFDDIPYLKQAQKEHDYFAQALRDNGVEVVYLEDLMTETLDSNPEIRDKFLVQYVKESGIMTDKWFKMCYDFLNSYKDNRKLVLKTMAGISLSEFKPEECDSLVDLIAEAEDMVIKPMPNLYFTRDPFASVGNGVMFNRMCFETRRRESIYSEYIFKYHPEYKSQVEGWYDRTSPFHIEGGDVINLSEETLAIGISERTEADAIEMLANTLFRNPKSSVKCILALKIPSMRACMHLDTVFTQVDYDKFVVHPGIFPTLEIYEIIPKEVGVNVKKLNEPLKKVLEKVLKVENITIIECGAGNKIISEREQWNDGSNTLCISPGKVVVYDRNEVTNELLVKNGVEIIPIPSYELSRGRGGPRCMSMPLYRED